ncbi:MAG: hypothetical protein COU69_02060 [Candidatus Pacebacteria bacterium CG10_big_fil_rev_8_21_14_0_10_56_10]|nr:MAG: hypothetical protein COU69_02060 [Candidatus Pacebacteria bacterium CG10_big_fil_rev_8_21_14_0_10_56_10]
MLRSGNKAKQVTDRSGFTLIELLVVVAIIAILVAIGITAFNSARTNAIVARDKAILDDLSKALGQYNVATGSYPTPDYLNAHVNGTFENILSAYIPSGLPDDRQINYWVDDTGQNFCLVMPFSAETGVQGNCNGANQTLGTCIFVSTPDPSDRYCIQSQL